MTQKKYEDYEPISGPMMCCALISVFVGAIYFGAFEKKESTAEKISTQKISVKEIHQKVIQKDR